MGDVSKLNIDGEWIELDIEGLGKNKFKIVPANTNRLIQIAREDLVGLMVLVVIDWDLTKKKEEIPCDDENKRKYLSALSEAKINNPEHALKGKVFETVGSEILAFSQNIKNFIKN